MNAETGMRGKESLESRPCAQGRERIGNEKNRVAQRYREASQELSNIRGRYEDLSSGPDAPFPKTIKREN